MKNMKNAVLGLSLAVAVASNAYAVNTFGFDTAAISTDVLTVGALMVGIATVFLGYKLVRRLIAR